MPTAKELVVMLITFGLTVFAWVFFRAENIEHAFSYISEILSSSLFELPNLTAMTKALTTLVLVGVFILIEWVGREQRFALQTLGHKWKRPIRLAMYYSIIIAIFWFGGEEQEFIYFQF